LFKIQSSSSDSKSKIACGSFGKRSNLDVKWKRNFTLKKNSKLSNYIGVKYHIRTNFPPDLIALHNFKNGYCGISQIEENKYCLCYLTTAESLSISENSISKMEKEILCRNPFLNKIFSSSEFLFSEPIAIAQISFEKKSKIENHVMLMGDAAGMITPLCGNGMSMALHGSKIAFKYIDEFLKDKITRNEMEQGYSDEWNSQFGKRLFAGRNIQRFFGSEVLSNFLIKSVKPFPKFVSYLIRQTHGAPY
jgi:hypothetical protein